MASGFPKLCCLGRLRIDRRLSSPLVHRFFLMNKSLVLARIWPILDEVSMFPARCVETSVSCVQCSCENEPLLNIQATCCVEFTYVRIQTDSVKVPI